MGHLDVRATRGRANEAAFVYRFASIVIAVICLLLAAKDAASLPSKIEGREWVMYLAPSGYVQSGLVAVAEDYGVIRPQLASAVSIGSITVRVILAIGVGAACIQYAAGRRVPFVESLLQAREQS